MNKLKIYKDKDGNICEFNITPESEKCYESGCLYYYEPPFHYPENIYPQRGNKISYGICKVDKNRFNTYWGHPEKCESFEENQLERFDIVEDMREDEKNAN